MKKIINFLGYIIIGLFLFDISFINVEKILALDFNDIYVIGFFIFFILAIIFRIIGKLFYKKMSIKGINPLQYREFHYIVQFILFSCILLLPSFFINHSFLSEHLGENNLYLRVYGRIAMGYFAMALIISPILQFVKHPIGKQHLILSRKILGILSAIFFLKHGLEYFALEYIFQTNYNMDIPYIDYVIKNLLIRYDALSGSIVGVLMLILLFTSNKFSLDFLGGKKWKKVQSLVFPTFIISTIHIAFTSRFSGYYIFLIGLVVITRLVSYLNRKQRRSSGKIIGYRCIPCGYIYNEKVGDLDSGIAPGTKFEDIPDDWRCPVCGVTKEDFEPIYEGDEISEKAEIVGYKMLTDDVLELNLKVSNLEKIEVDPGQFANIGFGEFSRSYSVVEVEKNILTFGIRLKDDGKGSEVLKKSKIGDILKFEGIFGNFILQNTNNPKVFIATGTGLSPMINMINNEKNIKGLKPSVDRNLLFGVAYEKDLFYLDKIKKIKNLKSRIYISREEVEGYEYGRISLKEYNFPKDTEFYICGNPKMVQTNIDYLQNNGFKNIYYEKFN